MDETRMPGFDSTFRASPLDRFRTSSLTRDVLVVSGVALLLGAIRLGAPSFWFDEGLTAYELDLPIGDLAKRQFNTLYLTVLKPWASIAGDSESALRFPSVVGLVLACTFTVMLGYRLFDRGTALIGGLLLATSPFLVKWSQQARGYSLLVALAVLATLVLVRALDRGSRAGWAVYGGAFSLVVIWHPVAGMLLVPAHLVLVAQRRERLLPHGPLAGLVILAFAVPCFAIASMSSIADDNVPTDWLSFPTPWVAAKALLEISGAGGVGVVLALLGLLVLRRNGKSDRAIALGVWAIAPFALALLVSLAEPIYLDRYLIIAAPAFALLAAAAIVGVASRARVVAVTAVALATCVGLVIFYARGYSGNWRGEDWRSAVHTVLQRQGEADMIIVVPRVAVPVAEYYGADAAEASAADSIWVLVWSETRGELPAAERRELGFGGHRLTERIQFGWRLSAQLWKKRAPTKLRASGSG